MFGLPERILQSLSAHRTLLKNGRPLMDVARRGSRVLRYIAGQVADNDGHLTFRVGVRLRVGNLACQARYMNLKPLLNVKPKTF